MPAEDATRRFSSRVEKYVLYRPGYPGELVGLLARECELTTQSVIADVGSGTGKLSEIFLAHGNRVFAVEPNAEMRGAAEQWLGNREGFVSVAATAEATTLADRSVDFVTAGQAAHWFDLPKSRMEFARILRPRGWVVLVWNERLTGVPFLEDYERLLLTYGTDYQEIRHEKTAERLGEFFAPSIFEERVLGLSQTFDYSGLEGRLLSSSYTPHPGDARYEPMLAALRELFEKYGSNGSVVFEYRTRVFYGQLDGLPS